MPSLTPSALGALTPVVEHGQAPTSEGWERATQMGGTRICSSSSEQSGGARGDSHNDSGELPTCSFLSVGQAFEGTQNVSDGMQLLGCKEEAWRVNVRLHGCDLQQVRGGEFITAIPAAICVFGWITKGSRNSLSH